MYPATGEQTAFVGEDRDARETLGRVRRVNVAFGHTPEAARKPAPVHRNAFRPRARRGGQGKIWIHGNGRSRALPSTESARCSLLGEAERLAVGQSLRKTPKLLVQPDIAVQAGNRAGAREAFPIRAAARLIF